MGGLQQKNYLSEKKTILGKRMVEWKGQGASDVSSINNATRNSLCDLEQINLSALQFPYT